MSDEKTPESENGDDVEGPSKEFNLPLAYSLLALAILAAIGIAIFIVLPFYQRR